jgi:glycosyltransferase involved in cell wall biosynthesis
MAKINGYPYKVLLLTQDLELCGAQRQLVELTSGLDRTRYEVRVGTLEPGGPFTETLVELGIPLVSFERRWRWDLSPIWRLARYLRQEQIDIVHSFLFLPNFYSRFAGRLAGTPAIVSSLRGAGIEGRHRYRLDVWTCRMCHVLIANSAAGRDHYIQHGGPPAKLVVIRNGINQARFSCALALHDVKAQWGLLRFDHLIGMVAAMENRKDHRLLLLAMKEVIHWKPQTGLILVGDGSLRPQLEALARDMGLAAHVVFTGQLRWPERLYPMFDIYVQASAEGEGISNSILEAMSYALPVVTTDVGGNREVVLDAVTGYLVPPGDSGYLAQVLISLLDDPPRRKEMGEEALNRVRTVFSLEKMVSTTQRLYEELLRTIQ